MLAAACGDYEAIPLFPQDFDGHGSMTKKPLIFIGCALVIGAVVSAAIWLHYRATTLQEAEPEEGEMTLDEHSTNSVIYFEDEVPPADPVMVGNWLSVEKPGWYKVYYDDDDGEGRYWGKEWDTNEDVMEEDLSYHGNGWFRWEKNKDTLREYATMDFRDVPIAHTFIVTVVDSCNISLKETNRRSTYHFTKD